MVISPTLVTMFGERQAGSLPPERLGAWPVIVAKIVKGVAGAVGGIAKSVSARKKAEKKRKKVEAERKKAAQQAAMLQAAVEQERSRKRKAATMGIIAGTGALALLLTLKK